MLTKSSLYFLILITLPVLFPAPLHPAEFPSRYKAIYDLNKTERNKAYQSFTRFANHLQLIKSKKYISAINELDALKASDSVIGQFIDQTVSEIMIAYLPPEEIINRLAKSDNSRRAMLYSPLYNNIYQLLSKRSIKSATINKFLALYPGIRQSEANKLRLFTQVGKGKRFYNTLKSLWKKDNLPSTKGGYPFEQSLIDHVEKYATAKDWLARFSSMYSHRKYNALSKEMGQQIKKFKGAGSSLGLDFFEIYLSSLAASRNYSILEKIIDTIDSDALFKSRPELLSTVLRVYMVGENYDKAEKLLQTARRIGVEEGMMHRLHFEKGRHFFKYDGKIELAENYFSQVEPTHLSNDDEIDFIWYVSQLKFNKENRSPVVSLLLGDASETGNRTYDSGFCYWREKLRHNEGIFFDKSDCARRYTNYYYGIKSIDFNESAEIFSKTCSESSIKSYKAPYDDYYLEWTNFIQHIKGDEAASSFVSNLDRPYSYYFLSEAVVQFNSRDDFHTQQSILSNQFSRWWSREDVPEFIKNCGLFYRTAYPLAFEKDVKRIAAKYNTLPAYLPFAIMREESHFNKTAVSSAGARGLMQLMPKTAKDVARRIKVRYRVQSLFDKDYNLTLGIFYINNLYNHFDKNLVHALAGYNGGPSNLKRWVKRSSTDDEDIFVELIPYTETRLYVKKVIRTLYLYKALYG